MPSHLHPERELDAKTPGQLLISLFEAILIWQERAITSGTCHCNGKSWAFYPKIKGSWKSPDELFHACSDEIQQVGSVSHLQLPHIGCVLKGGRQSEKMARKEITLPLSWPSK